MEKFILYEYDYFSNFKINPLIASIEFMNNNAEGHQPPPYSPSIEYPQYRTYKSRWYILLLFATMCCHQVCKTIDIQYFLKFPYKVQ